MPDTEITLWTVLRLDWGRPTITGGGPAVYPDVEDATRVAKGRAMNQLNQTPGMEPSDVVEQHYPHGDEDGYIYVAEGANDHWAVTPVEIVGTFEEGGDE